MPNHSSLCCRICAAPALHALASATQAAVTAVTDGAHVAPSLTDDIQDSVAAIYSFLQLAPDLACQEGQASVCAVADAMIMLIQVLVCSCNLSVLEQSFSSWPKKFRGLM